MFLFVLLFNYFFVFNSLFALGGSLYVSNSVKVEFPRSSIDLNSIDFASFVTGRFEKINLNEVYEGNAAITFDYSGVTIQGIINLKDEKLNTKPYSLFVNLIYHCMNPNIKGNLFMVRINGKETIKIDIGSASMQTTCGKLTKVKIAENLNGSVEVQMVKITEPNFNVKNANISNNVTFAGFEVYGITNVRIVPLPRPDLRIEFIGDSITCGYQISCHEKEKMILSSNELYQKIGKHDQKEISFGYSSSYIFENVTKTYAGRTCKYLDASCHYECWSGRGMAFNYGSFDTLMPDLYERTMATVPSVRWDFNNTLFTPDVVVINLGTNDINRANKPKHWEKKYMKKYIKLINELHERYNRNKKISIIGVCGPMSFAYCAYVEKVINESKSEFTNLHYFRHSNLLNANNTCSGHPDEFVSIPLAEELSKFIRKIL